MFHWAQFLSYAVITALTPGPNNILSMSCAGRFGLRQSFPLNLGIWVGFSLVMLLCTLLCDLLSSALPLLQAPMRYVGAAYMLWLAWKTWKSPQMTEERHGAKGFGAGLILQFINPKIYLYCMISMEAYILPYYQGQTGPLIGFALLLALIGFLFTLCWALFGSLCKLLFSRYARITNGIMALLLTYCAVALFL